MSTGVFYGYLCEGKKKPLELLGETFKEGVKELRMIKVLKGIIFKIVL